MTSLAATSWENQGIHALWAYACLNLNAGALGLLAVEVTTEPSQPRVWTDGRVLKVSRVALHDWLAQEDTSPVVVLPEGEWAPAFGRAVRQRLRYPKQPTDPVDVPEGLEDAFDGWAPRSQQWGRGELENMASIQAVGQAWTVDDATRQWRMAHGAMPFPSNPWAARVCPGNGIDGDLPQTAP